uniref:Uncharacterized protein n=1 Tax=Panagrolaimus sp. JU765 TaxID=591449 RepID=A0AC34Q1S3_9BILA
MTMSSIVVSLVGGPPWGFRISQDKDGLPYISQVLPEGRADKEGIKFGDYIDQVNGENCYQIQQIHNKMRSAHGVLRLRLKRSNDPCFPKQLIRKPMSENHLSIPLPVSKSNAAAKPPVINSYNGGMRGSAQEKKHYFEAAIAKQIQPIPPPVKKSGKKLFATPILPNFGFSSESETELSGCDSVSGENYSTSGYGNQPSVASSEGTENSWYESTPTESSYGSKTPTIFDYENYDQRDRMDSATPIVVEYDGKQSPLFYWNENGSLNANQNVNDTSTDSGVTMSNSEKLIPLPPPPPPTKTWQLKVDEMSPKAIPAISTTVATGSASGEVEIPRPKSVAELRAEIATKLEVRNPAGQVAAPISPAVPINSVIVHSPLRPQHGKLTPSVSLLSLDQFSNMVKTSKPEILPQQNFIERSPDFPSNEKNGMMFRDGNNDHICIEEQHGHRNDTPLLSKRSTDDEKNIRELPTSSIPIESRLESQVQNLHVNGSDVTVTASVEPKAEKSTDSSNRLGELIELARKSFNDDTGRQLVDFLWKKPNNDEGNRFKLRNGSRLQRPHSVYELSFDMENINGSQTLPIIRRKQDNSNVNDEKTAWYKEIHKLCHKIPYADERTVSYRIGETESSMLNNRPITPQSRLEQQQNEQLLFEQQQRRAKSVGRYDPVADMEILEHWSRQKQQNVREQNGSQQGSPNPLTKGVNEMKKMTMEEILQRQKAEKLSEELNDQKNRQHGYFPGASPALQNNVQRFEHFLHGSVGNNVENTESRCSTPLRRPFLANPIRTCTALYKFLAQSPRELSLNRGDVVRVHREVDSNWIEGERNGHVGIFPASYVQMDEDASTSKNRVRALYPFQARNRNELSLKKGEILRKRREIDPNWFEGTNSKGQIGIFPKCYVQPFIEGQEEEEDINEVSVLPDRPKTPKIVATNHPRATSPLSSKKEVERSHQIQQWEQRHGNFGFSGPAKIVPKNSETYRALYPYKPEHPDELELQENDIVFVVQKCDDGWMIGTLLRTGQFGTFPGNYVEKH